MEASQFLERFRLLSREIQINIQRLEKNIEQLKKNPDNETIQKIQETTKNIHEYWDDFSGWVLISTLDDINEARRNCVSGLIEVQSKITRSKKPALGPANQHGVKIDTKNVAEAEVSTYITYFEQFLDLLLLNAVKYSPRGYSVDVSSQWKDGAVIISIDSIGPLIEKHEKPLLGNKGFRAANAIKTNKSGDGFGLNNVLKLAELLEIDIRFNLSHRKIVEFSSIPYSDFSVVIAIKNTV